MPLDPHVTSTIRAWAQQAQPSPPPHYAHALRDLVYALQAFDALRSAQDFKRGAYETDPLMRPFSHGGAPMMMAGFGLGDLLRNLALRHAGPGAQTASDALQAAASLAGILQTGRNMHLPHGARAGMPPPVATPTPAPSPTPPGLWGRLSAGSGGTP